MRIDALSDKADRAGRFWARLSDGSRLALYRQTVEDFHLCPGAELTEEAYAALLQAAGEMSAKMRAVRIVSASSVSRKDLRQRLIHKGETPEQAEEAVSWMEQLRLVDDRETARQLVNRCAAKGYGPARAKQTLYEKKIPRELWDEALENYPDQTESIRAYLQAHLPADRDPRLEKRAVDALVRRGHSFRQIRQVLAEMNRDTILEEQ